MAKAVFLDRDDTLIIDTDDYCVNTIDKIKLFPDTIQALSELAKLDYLVILVTNQETISNGRITQGQFDTVHAEVVKQLEASGVKISKTCLCPHTVEDNCNCRKPKPTMILEAAEEFDIDLTQSCMVGDRVTDVQTGIAAGTRTILVKTAQIPCEAPQATHTSGNLLDAINFIKENPKIS